MAVFRVEKTRDYTVMANHHLRNTELSLMLSLPEGWDYTTKGLARICKDGVDSVCASAITLQVSSTPNNCLFGTIPLSTNNPDSLSSIIQ